MEYNRVIFIAEAKKETAEKENSYERIKNYKR